jgi:hypothetical protein
MEPFGRIPKSPHSVGNLPPNTGILTMFEVVVSSPVHQAADRVVAEVHVDRMLWVLHIILSNARNWAKR